MVQDVSTKPLSRNKKAVIAHLQKISGTGEAGEGAGLNFAPTTRFGPDVSKKAFTGDPIVVIGGGVNGSAIAMELMRELKEQNSAQEVILFDLQGYPDPNIVANSSGGDTRITRIANAEKKELSYTATDGARFYTKLQREFETSSNIGLQKVAAMLKDRYENTMMYNPHGFVWSMPRVKESREFHGKSNKDGNSYEKTLRNAIANEVRHEVMDGYEFADRFPGFKIADSDRNLTDVYYEPPCPEKDERKDNWFATGGTLYAERCVAAHLALFEMYGGIFRPYTKVESAKASEKSGVDLTLADGSTLTASKVVFAGNRMNTPFLPTSIFQVAEQRQVVGFTKGENMKILSSDGPNPLPSFVIYFRTTGEKADYAYGIPATQYSINYKGYFKAARENGVYGDPKLKEIIPGELSSLYNFTSNFAQINQPERMRGLICFYGVSPGSIQVFTKHPVMSGGYIVHNCDGGGFKHAAGAARPFARMILGMESNNPNINLEGDFALPLLTDYDKPLQPNPELDQAIKDFKLNI